MTTIIGKLNFILFIIAAVLIACENHNVKGSGKVTELDVKQIQTTFIEEKATGFLYVKSALDIDSDSEMQLIEIERVAKAENIDFYVFDQNKNQTYLTNLGVNQYSKPLPFIKMVIKK